MKTKILPSHSSRYLQGYFLFHKFSLEYAIDSSFFNFFLYYVTFFLSRFYKNIKIQNIFIKIKLDKKL